jgi:hypothetical protein
MRSYSYRTFEKEIVFIANGDTHHIENVTAISR